MDRICPVVFPSEQGFIKKELLRKQQLLLQSFSFSQKIGRTRQ